MEPNSSLRINRPRINVNLNPTFAPLCTFIQPYENVIGGPQQLLNQEFGGMQVLNFEEVFNISEIDKDVHLNMGSNNRSFPFQQMPFLLDGHYHSFQSETWSPIKFQLPPSPISVQLPPSPISVKRFEKIDEITEDFDTQTTEKRFTMSHFGEIDSELCFEKDNILNQAISICDRKLETQEDYSTFSIDSLFSSQSVVYKSQVKKPSLFLTVSKVSENSEMKNEKINKGLNKRVNERRKELSDNIRSLNSLLPYAICQNSRVSREVTLQKAHEYIVYLNEEIEFVKSQFNKAEFENKIESLVQPVELTALEKSNFAPYVKPSSTKALDILKRKKKYKNMVKRPMNSFMLFSKENRPTFFKCFPGLSNREVSKLLGIAWQSVDEAHKNFYREVSVLQRL
ncbi:uncharacterized protein LOC105845833 isoform X2 [Hydra vulgaris]|uniref:uncharacterized protein LOC105845833 isoform X2 n=1 Tax=Hydra vulgaris TaxID=6087 RepID=UPI00064112C3|nr:uncharacterized protein LOC105845833 isoform X2 [Hydra vulgaris]